MFKTKQSKAIWSIDISYDDAVIALGTEQGSIELFNQSKLIANAGKLLQDLVQMAVNFNASPDKQVELSSSKLEEENPGFMKVYYTKSTQSGILCVKFSWLNFLFTVGSVDK